MRFQTITIKWFTALLLLTLAIIFLFNGILHNCFPLYTSVRLRINDQLLVPSNKMDNIFWFVQISDIHISLYHDRSRISDLREFLMDDIYTIDPAFILVTGDLIDAKTEDDFSTHHDPAEWHLYFSLLNETKIADRIPWLDLRGNHDCFDVVHRAHISNTFKTHSVMGEKKLLGSYKYVHETKFGLYSFIGIDACPEPGLKRPFNFYGTLNERDITALRLMARSTVNHNYTLWFTHYPTTALSLNYNTALKPAIESTNTLAYLCGHLHHLGGISYTMYTRRPEGHLELELADWKVNRRYRIMAIDHDLLSFTDTSYMKWPVILVTNPKELSLSAPLVEPLSRMVYSTHIRLLIFSPHNIDRVFAKVDGIRLKDEGSHINGPLFTILWDPSCYTNGVHTLNVEVHSVGEISVVTTSFSFDQRIPIYSIISNFILLSHLPSILFYLFFFVWGIFILSILVSLFIPETFGSYVHCLYLTKSMKSIQMLKITLLMANFYMVIGPWCVGVVNSYYSLAILYLYGVQLPNDYIEFYYMYGIALEQLLTFNIPCTGLIMLIAHSSNANYVIFYHLFFSVLVMNHFKRCYHFYRWLGFVGVLLNPTTVWTMLLYCYIYFSLLNRRKEHYI